MSEQTVALVAAVVDGLQPLADATPGEPVRAEDWNAVVSAVIDLAQVALASEQSAADRIDARFAPADHDHLGAVGPGWFDAAAREELEGSRNRIDLEQELTHANRTMGELSARLDRLAGDIDSLRRRLLTVEDNDLGRHQRLERVATSVDSLGEQGAEISDLRSTVHGLRTQVGMALSLRSQLTDDTGAPIDLVAMRTSVGRLSDDRERLLDAAGDILDARAFEQRVARLENRVPTGGSGGTAPDLDRFRDELLGEVDVRVDERVGSRVDPLGTELAGTRDDLAGLNDRVDERFADLDGISERLRATEDGVGRLESTTAGIADLTVRLGRVESRAAGNSTRLGALDELSSRIDGIDRTLTVFDGIPERVAQLDTRLVAAEAAVRRFPGLESQVAELVALRSDVDRLSTQLEVVGSQASGAAASVDALASRFTQVESTSIDLRTRFATIERTQRTQATSLAALRDQLGSTDRPPVGGGTIPITGGGTIPITGGGIIR